MRVVVTAMLLLALLGPGCATLQSWHQEACSHAQAAKDQLSALEADLQVVRQVVALVLPGGTEVYIPGVGVVTRDLVVTTLNGLDVALMLVRHLIDQACPPLATVQEVEAKIQRMVQEQPLLQYARRRTVTKRL